MPEEASWLARLIDHEVAAHWADATEIVEATWKQNPTGDPDLLINGLISDKARIAALVGIGTGALVAVPGIGAALSLGAVVPEALYLAKVQIDIALVVSLLYERHLTQDEVKGVIVTCLVLALGADFVKANLIKSATKLTRKVVEKAIVRMGERQLLALLAKIGVRATKAGILSKVPLVGIPLNAVMNYGQIEGFGWAIKKFISPSFVMCGGCGKQTGRLNKFCPVCGLGVA